MPLKPSGQTPTSSPIASSRSASGLQASVLPGLAGQRAEPGRAEDQVGAEHPQVPVRRVVVEQRQRGHHRVQRQRAGVVGDDQRAAGRPARCAGRTPPPGTTSRTAGGTAGPARASVRSAVEAELVDLVVAGDPAAQEGQAAGDPALPVRRGRPGGRLGGRGTARGPAPARRRRRAAGSPARHPRRASRPSRAAAAARTASRMRALGPRAPRPAAPASPARRSRTTSSNAATVSYRGRVAELGPQPGRVDHPAELEEAAAAPGRSPAARPGARPGRRACTDRRRHRDRHPAGPADHLGQQQHPGAADVDRARPAATASPAAAPPARRRRAAAAPAGRSRARSAPPAAAGSAAAGCPRRGPITSVNRSTATETSGRRRAKPRT